MDLIAFLLIMTFLGVEWYWHQRGMVDLRYELIRLLLTSVVIFGVNQVMYFGESLGYGGGRGDDIFFLTIGFLLVAILLILFLRKQRKYLIQILLPVPLMVSVQGLLNLSSHVMEALLTSAVIIFVGNLYELYLEQKA